MLMNKKGNAAIITVLLALAIIAMLIINYSSRECDSNKDCSKSAYCGSDYKCHEYPKEIIVKEQSYVWPALILGLSLIVAAYVYRGGKLPFEKKE